VYPQFARPEGDPLRQVRYDPVGNSAGHLYPNRAAGEELAGSIELLDDPPLSPFLVIHACANMHVQNTDANWLQKEGWYAPLPYLKLLLCLWSRRGSSRPFQGVA